MSKYFVVRTTLIEILPGELESDVAEFDSEELPEETACALFEKMTGEDPEACLLVDDDPDLDPEEIFEDDTGDPNL